MSEQKTISEFYEQDHDRLDELFKTFQKLKRSDFAKAKEAFKEFKFGLQRHIVWEEGVLFPLWEEKTGMSEGGPTFVMRASIARSATARSHSWQSGGRRIPTAIKKSRY